MAEIRTNQSSDPDIAKFSFIDGVIPFRFNYGLKDMHQLSAANFSWESTAIRTPLLAMSTLYNTEHFYLYPTIWSIDKHPNNAYDVTQVEDNIGWTEQNQQYRFQHQVRALFCCHCNNHYFAVEGNFHRQQKTLVIWTSTGSNVVLTSLMIIIRDILSLLCPDQPLLNVGRFNRRSFDELRNNYGVHVTYGNTTNLGGNICGPWTLVHIARICMEEQEPPFDYSFGLRNVNIMSFSQVTNLREIRQLGCFVICTSLAALYLARNTKQINFNATAPLLGFLNTFYDRSYDRLYTCLLYTSPSPRDGLLSRMPSSA